MLSTINQKFSLALCFVMLSIVSNVTMAATVTDLTNNGITTTQAVAKFLTAVFFLGAVFAGGMFGWKIYQHGKDAREHKLSTAFIYLLAAACLIGAGFFVSTMANTLGVDTKVTSGGSTTSFGS